MISPRPRQRSSPRSQVAPPKLRRRARNGPLKLAQRSTQLLVFPPFVIRVQRQPTKSDHANTAFQYSKTKAELEKDAAKLDQYRKDAGASAMAKIDAADKKIEAEAAKAKSGISSWFGGK